MSTSGGITCTTFSFDYLGSYDEDDGDEDVLKQDD